MIKQMLKPEPEIYLCAAETFGIKPEDFKMYLKTSGILREV